MSYHIRRDHTYELYGGVAMSHDSVEMAYAMPHPHLHSDYEFFFLIDGGRKFFLSDKICSILSHSALIIPPDEPHQSTINLKTHMERYAIYISPKLIDSILKENPALNALLKIRTCRFSDETFANIFDLIKKIQTQLDLRDSFSACHLKSIVMEMMILLLREPQTDENQFTSDIAFQKNDIRLQAPIDFILEHYAESITLEQCARIANMSSSHFSRQFHAVTGIGFRNYLTKVRIENACKLLKSTDTDNVTEIAIQTGFSDSSYFTHCFKQQVGMTPTAYKKQESVTN